MGVDWERPLESRWATPVILVALTALSLFIRTRQLNAGFWIDEGISVGLAHHHWSSIPALLRQDGSPPAYYMLLGLWIRVFGDSERATHTLSLIFGLACIPLAYATARSLFDRRTGLVCALLAALNPFLTYYAQETRMYELEAFLSFVIAYAYVQGVLQGRRLWAALLVPAVALMLYAHNWGLFVCIGLAVTTAVFARERLKLFGLVTLGIAVLYAPWLPTLLSQARHTGAPWSTVPTIHDLVLAPMYVLGTEGAFIALALVGGAGLAEVVRRHVGEERRTVLALATLGGVTIVSAFISSQISPGVDRALLRGRPRPRAPARRARARACAPARLRRARRRRLPLELLQRSRRQGERALDHRRRRALHAPGRARDLDPPGAGPGPALLPRPWLSLGEHARARRRSAGLRLARRGRPGWRTPRRNRPSTD